MIPYEKISKEKIRDSLNDSIKGIFLSSIKLALYQALYTWVIFDCAEISYMYLYTLFAAFFRIVPLVSTSLIGIFGGIQLFLSHGRHPLICLCVILLYY